ncbi:MAG: glutamate--cysteine ligase [Actinomycetota bacterium]|nr:glutamate--cysteine ligase [Actinomycetota bacterium]
MVRTIGIEEELLLVDPDTGQMSPGARQVIKEFHEHGGRARPTVATDELDHELFRHQLEVRTDPTTDLDDAAAQVVDARRTAGEAADATGLAAIACGIVPRGETAVVVSPYDRYRDMVSVFGEVARQGGTCGMHVHVGIESDEEGVAVIDRIAPWLPVVLAISANSPFHDDRDTGYASWRSQVWTRWPTGGSTQRFGSVEAYRALCQFLLDSGAARDPGMLYFETRLSEANPTVEIRVSDMCTDPADALLIAAVARGLVETAARAWRAGDEPREWRTEELRACHWRAARYGVADALVLPETRQLAGAREVLDALTAAIRPALEEAGDLEVVTEGLRRVLSHSGARAQRAAYERTGDVRGVVDDLIDRTRASWRVNDG